MDIIIISSVLVIEGGNQASLAVFVYYIYSEFANASTKLSAKQPYLDIMTYFLQVTVVISKVIGEFYMFLHADNLNLSGGKILCIY